MTFCYDSAVLESESSKPPLFTTLGAGEGNRTLISGLGSPHSTTEPHPLALRLARQARAECCISTKRAAVWQQVCIRSLRHLKPLNGLPQFLFNLPPPFRRHNLAAARLADIKTVNGRAAFGHDARPDDVQREFGQCL